MSQIVDWSALTDAINFQALGEAVLPPAAALIGTYLAIKGVRVILSAVLDRGDGGGDRDAGGDAALEEHERRMQEIWDRPAWQTEGFASQEEFDQAAREYAVPQERDEE